MVIAPIRPGMASVSMVTTPFAASEDNHNSPELVGGRGRRGWPWAARRPLCFHSASLQRAETEQDDREPNQPSQKFPHFSLNTILDLSVPPIRLTNVKVSSHPPSCHPVGV